MLHNCPRSGLLTCSSPPSLEHTCLLPAAARTQIAAACVASAVGRPKQLSVHAGSRCAGSLGPKSMVKPAAASNLTAVLQPIADSAFDSSSSSSSNSMANSSDPAADLQVLQQLVAPHELETLLSRHPEVLLSHPSPLASWVEFLREYPGLSCHDISKLLLSCPELFATSSIYESGRTLLFFKHLGWQDADIRGRIVPYYPHLMAKQLERDICPVLAHLYRMGCSKNDIRLLVWEFPRIFNKDYRRHIRKFQFLGMYGLPPVGTQLQQQRQGPSSSSSSSNELPDSLQWLMMSVQ